MRYDHKAYAKLGQTYTLFVGFYLSFSSDLTVIWLEKIFFLLAYSMPVIVGTGLKYTQDERAYLAPESSCCNTAVDSCKCCYLSRQSARILN